MKGVLRACVPPFEQFNNFYKLEDIIELYQELWYDDDDDDLNP